VRRSELQGHTAYIDADVWILTETRIDLQPGSGHRLAAHSKLSPDRTPDECWTAIWVRNDIESLELPTSDEKRAACAKIVFPWGQSMIVVGTVLPWLNDRSKLPLKGADAFAAELSIQQRDWHRFRLAHPSAPLCIAGDLNQDLLLSGHYYGSAKGRVALRAALEACGLTCLTGGAWDPIVRESKGAASIDHICLTGIPSTDHSSDNPPFPATLWPSTGKDGKHLSDHRGVAVDLPVPISLLP
jgi:hypothetical protein